MGRVDCGLRLLHGLSRFGERGKHILVHFFKGAATNPLSPYLFIIGMEVLTRSFKAAAEQRSISGFLFKRGGIKVKQLAFANDCLLLGWWFGGGDVEVVGGYVLCKAQPSNQRGKSSIRFGARVNLDTRRHLHTSWLVWRRAMLQAGATTNEKVQPIARYTPEKYLKDKNN